MHHQKLAHKRKYKTHFLSSFILLKQGKKNLEYKFTTSGQVCEISYTYNGSTQEIREYLVSYDDLEILAYNRRN